MWRTLRITSFGTLWDNNIPTDHFKDSRLLMNQDREGTRKISDLLSGNPVVYPSSNFVSGTKRCLRQSIAPNTESQERHSLPDLMKPIISSLKWHNFGTLAAESIKVSGQQLTGPEKKIATYRNAQFVGITAEIKSFQVHISPPCQRATMSVK